MNTEQITWLVLANPDCYIWIPMPFENKMIVSVNAFVVEKTGLSYEAYHVLPFTDLPKFIDWFNFSITPVQPNSSEVSKWVLEFYESCGEFKHAGWNIL